MRKRFAGSRNQAMRRRVFAGALAAAAMLFGSATASADVGAAGVGNQVCDFGEVCLFAWPGYDGPTWDANGCGWHVLDGWMQNQTSSVRTHGNSVTLYDWNHGTNSWDAMIYIDDWSYMPLNVTADRADAITVWC